MSRAATIHADMRAAFRAALRAVGDMPAQIAWEGRPFAPTVGQPFIRETLRPLTSTPRALGKGGTIAHLMTGNLVLFFPAGKGTGAIDEAAGLILQAFAPGTSLAYGDAAGTVAQAERYALNHEADWVSCPITITITAHTVN